MEILTIKNLQIIIRRSLSLLLALCLACVWVLLGATPALAQARTINYSHTALQNRDFSHTDLVGAVFAAAEMRGANFESANLSRAILTQGKLQGANLAGANLTNVLADQVILDEANLTNAILIDATLTSAHFYHTKVDGADFTDALLDRFAIALLCQDATGVNPVTGASTRESLGCR